MLGLLESMNIKLRVRIGSSLRSRRNYMTWNTRTRRSLLKMRSFPTKSSVSSKKLLHRNRHGKRKLKLVLMKDSGQKMKLLRHTLIPISVNCWWVQVKQTNILHLDERYQHYRFLWINKELKLNSTKTRKNLCRWIYAFIGSNSMISNKSKKKPKTS